MPHILNSGTIVLKMDEHWLKKNDVARLSVNKNPKTIEKVHWIMAGHRITSRDVKSQSQFILKWGISFQPTNKWFQ